MKPTPNRCGVCGLAACAGPHLCLGMIKLARLRNALAEHAADLAAQSEDEENLRELLMDADIEQETDLLRYLGLNHRADLCDILDAWDDAGPVKRTTILTILGGE